MTRLLISLAIVVCGLCSCGEQTATPEKSDKQVAMTPPPPAKTPMDLRFWINEGATAEKDSRIVEILDHPCGAVATLRVDAIPEPTDTIDVDRIIEVGPDGSEIANWRVPTDSFHVAARGELIGVSDNSALSIWVNPVGMLYTMNIAERRTPDPELVECPDVEHFRNSAYLQCYHLTDSATGKARLFAAEGTCT